MISWLAGVPGVEAPLHWGSRWPFNKRGQNVSAGVQ